MLITRSGLCKRELDRDSFVVQSLEGNRVEGCSSEWNMHRLLYIHRKEINCILHVHAPNTTAFAAAHKVPEVNALVEGIVAIGEVVLVPFANPGSEKLGELLIQSSHSAMVYLLANHGVVVGGSSVYDALYRLERVELLASIQLHASLIGGIVPLSEAQISGLHE